MAVILGTITPTAFHIGAETVSEIYLGTEKIYP